MYVTFQVLTFKGDFCGKKKKKDSVSFSHKLVATLNKYELNSSHSVVDPSPPSNVEIKNEWKYTSTSPICLHFVHRDIFICN